MSQLEEAGTPLNVIPPEHATYQPPQDYLNINSQIPGQVPGQHVMTTVTMNQVQAGVVDQGALNRVRQGLRSDSVYVDCPYCHQAQMTKVVRNVSWCNICLCICTSPMFWLLFQAIRAKDINCCDANHSCSVCSTPLGYYTAC